MHLLCFSLMYYAWTTQNKDQCVSLDILTSVNILKKVTHSPKMKLTVHFFIIILIETHTKFDLKEYSINISKEHEVINSTKLGSSLIIY